MSLSHFFSIEIKTNQQTDYGILYKIALRSKFSDQQCARRKINQNYIRHKIVKICSCTQMLWLQRHKIIGRLTIIYCMIFLLEIFFDSILHLQSLSTLTKYQTCTLFVYQLESYITLYCNRKYMYHLIQDNRT